MGENMLGIPSIEEYIFHDGGVRQWEGAGVGSELVVLG